MLFEVNLPSLSPTMEEGKIVKWIKNEKDHEKAKKDFQKIRRKVQRKKAGL